MDDKKAYIYINLNVYKNTIEYIFKYKKTIKKYNSVEWDLLINDAIKFSNENGVSIQFYDYTK